MKPISPSALLAALAFAVLTGITAQAEVNMVPSADPAMNAAIEKAKATLPAFFDRLANPQPGDDGFAIKIKYLARTGDGEHIWANKVERKGDMVSATINNEPRDIAGLKIGQRVTVPLGQLTDWMYTRDGKIHGGQTIRAIIPALPKAQADQYRAMLAPE